MAHKAGSSKRTKNPKPDLGGMDAELMQAFSKSLANKIPKNPLTGRIELTDIMKFLGNNAEDMDMLLNHVEKLGVVGIDQDLSGFDYASLARTVKKGNTWVLKMDTGVFVDETGRTIENSAVHTTKGARPTFTFFCYDNREQYRCTHHCTGLPESDVVLKVIQKAIAAPMPPLKPCLPEWLILTLNLQPHAEALRPFLDSLPKPFRWRFETRREADEVVEGTWKLNEEGYRVCWKLAEKEKAAGNAAFSKKDRKAAIKAYSTAIDALLDATVQARNDEEEKKAEQFRAICLSNRATTYLLPGEGFDAEKALKDGQSSERADPSYNKCYIRQASAYQHLGRLEDGVGAIARALQRTDLENDRGLVDRLTELLTDGKGFAKSEPEFKQWLQDITATGRKSAEALTGLEGEWRRRCDAHLAQWKRT